MESPLIPVICDRCRAEGTAGDDPFTAIRDLLTFEPVSRRAHVNNWTAEHQRAFVAALAMTGSPRQAARALGRHAFGAEQLRSAKGGKSFAEAWDAALELYRERELFRIKDNLAGLAEQQQARDEGGLPTSHLRALPAPSSRRGEGWGERDHAPCPHCDELDEELRVVREHDESLRRVRRKLFMTRRIYLLSIADDPERRAAWELLCGPVDWPAARAMQAQPDEDLQRASIMELQGAGWQVPLKTGFAPDLTEPGYNPAGDPLQQLHKSVGKHDPRWSASNSPSPLQGTEARSLSGGQVSTGGQGEGLTDE
jgi:hypothetical protein